MKNRMRTWPSPTSIRSVSLASSESSMVMADRRYLGRRRDAYGMVWMGEEEHGFTRAERMILNQDESGWRPSLVYWRLFFPRPPLERIISSRKKGGINKPNSGVNTGAARVRRISTGDIRISGVCGSRSIPPGVDLVGWSI